MENNARWSVICSVKAEHVLKQMIVDAQKDDVELQKKVQLVREGVKTDYSIKENGEVYYNNKLCVPDDEEVKNKLLYEAHNTILTMHLGGTKMYQEFKTVLLVARNEKRCDKVIGRFLLCKM